MESSLRERLGRLGPVKAVDHVPSGLPAVLDLEIAVPLDDVKAVSLMLAFCRRGLPMIDAKGAVERLLEHRRLTINLPFVEDIDILSHELTSAGLRIARHEMFDPALSWNAS